MRFPEPVVSFVGEVHQGGDALSGRSHLEPAKLDEVFDVRGRVLVGCAGGALITGRG